MAEYLILTDEKDQFVGLMEKMLVHQHGLLHRAFSVFIFNSKNQLLLQQRADEKYHSPGLWSNTCCSHPLNGETVDNAVKRRLIEELGLNADATFKFSFIYRHEFQNGLTEHELDHVYFGVSDDVPHPNPLEVKDWKYIKLKDLKEELEQNPENYSAWLRICFPKIEEHFQQQFSSQ